MLRSKVAVFVQLYEARLARESVRPRAEDGSGRLSERLLAARPADAAATIEALVRIQAALNEDLDVVNLARRLASEVVALTSAAGVAVLRVRASSDAVVPAGRLGDVFAELDPSSALLRPVREGHRILRLDNVRASGAADVPRIVGSLLAVPIVCSGEVEAILVLVHEASDMFDPRDEELAAIAASHAAGAFENARLYAEAQQARDRAELAELELRAGETRLRIALEAADLGTWEYNPQRRSFRLDAKCRELVGPDIPFEALVTEAIAGGHRRLDIEHQLVDEDRWLAVRGQSIVEHERAVRFIGVVQDVTEKKRTELERAELLASERRARSNAEAANRAKDEFLATVSHELRNPLNAILGWSRVLIEDPETERGERERRGLDVILRNAKAQVQLVEDILEVSRIVTGKLRVSVAPFELAKVFEAAVETIRPAAQAKRVTLVTEIDPSVKLIVADEDRIQQILWNLLSNAVKFTKAGGEVTARVWLEGPTVILRVTDTGEGISADFLPFVFDRFRQFDGSTTRTHGGLGLGLAIVRHLAELHGGTVHAASEGRGLGAAFSVMLPVAPSSPDASVSLRVPTSAELRRPALARARPLAGLRVLILDDDVDMRDLIGMILEDAGASVVAAATVSMAMELLAEDIPHVAISDLAMPVEDGYAFAERVRQVDALRALPLVAMTAYTRVEDRQRVLASGFDRHVPKPIEPDQLVLALAEMLGRAP